MIYLLFILGLVVGSFLNVCISRLPRGESLLFPASHCPHCNKKIDFYDLAPVLSYLILKGKCRSCQGKISPRYPIVEALTGGLFILSWLLSNGGILVYTFNVIFLSLQVIIFFTDLEKQVVPDLASYSGIALGVVFNLLFGKVVNSLIGIALGFGLFWVVKTLGKRIFQQEAMGEGDLLIAAMLGAYLGWQKMLLAVFLGYFLAALVAGIFLALKKVKFGERVPFGPALAVGGVIALFWGGDILRWYFKLFI